MKQLISLPTMQALLVLMTAVSALSVSSCVPYEERDPDAPPPHYTQAERSILGQRCVGTFTNNGRTR